VLPLLQHVEVIQHRGALNPFTLRLRADTRPIAPDAGTASEGNVDRDDREPLLRFAAIRRRESGGWPTQLRDHPSWPRNRCRDENLHERIRKDETQADAVAPFYSGAETTRPAHLHWAVHLPLEEGWERLNFDGHRARHSLILHGQFFLDDGRHLRAQQTLHEAAADPHSTDLDEAGLQETWNRLLAQKLLAPAESLDRAVSYGPACLSRAVEICREGQAPHRASARRVPT
jgi:hypothetical protein